MEVADSLMEFVNTLRRRGLNFTIKNNRLRVHPKHAFKLLTDEERFTLKRDRTAIKATVKRGLPHLTHATAANTPSAPAALKPFEPEPVMWTYDYNTRITAAHVQAAGVPPGLSKQKAYERARDWLEEQRQKQEREAYILSLHNAAAELRSDYTDSRPRRSWLEEVGNG